MKPYSNINTIWGLIYTCFSIFAALGEISKIITKYQKNHGHVIQSVKLYISLEKKPYTNVKAIWESIYTCFCVSVELGQVG